MRKIGDTLRKIREKYGYSTDDISKRTGIKREDLEKIESGQKPNDMRFLDAVQKYARDLGLNPFHLFDLKFKYPNVNFRARFIGEVEKKQVQRVIGFIYLISNFYSDITGEELPELPYYPVSIKEGEGETVAQACRLIGKLKKEHNVGTLEEALDKFKVYVLEINIGKLDGFSIYVPGITIPVIVINKEPNNICRKRFTLAHELLHLLSDRDKDFPPLAEEKFFADELNESPELKIRETLANKFAQYLLVPFDVANKSKFNIESTKKKLMEEYCVSEKVLDYIAKDMRKESKNYGLKCACRKSPSYPRIEDLLRKSREEIESAISEYKELPSLIPV